MIQDGSLILFIITNEKSKQCAQYLQRKRSSTILHLVIRHYYHYHHQAIKDTAVKVTFVNTLAHLQAQRAHDQQARIRESGRN